MEDVSKWSSDSQSRMWMRYGRVKSCGADQDIKKPNQIEG